MYEGGERNDEGREGEGEGEKWHLRPVSLTMVTSCTFGDTRSVGARFLIDMELR